MKTILKFKTAILAFFISQGIYAQSPGGVSGAQLWYKANLGITQSGTVTQWNNSASSSYNLLQQGAASTLPAYNTSSINFNPTVRFDGVDDRLYSPAVPQTVTTTASAPFATSQYVVYRRLASSLNPIYTHSDGVGGTWNIGAFSGGQMLITNRIVPTSLPATNEIRIQEIDGTSSSATTYVNGTSSSSTFTGSAASIGTENFWVGAQGTTGFANVDVAEIVVYNGAQPTTNRQQIESYLALKYGITKSGNYISSGAAFTTWNATINIGYNNNIAGIGRDDNSALYQKQSMSINSGQQVLIGLNTMSNANDTNTGTLTNQQFLVWGDNGLAKTPSVAISGISDANVRFASVWKVQNTTTVGTVRVMWPQGLTNLKLVQNASDPTFSAGNTVTNMTGTQVINGITYNYADVTLADGQYFTFAANVNSPGGIASNLQLWLKADVGISSSSWIDQSINGRNATSIGTPTITNYVNFNPAASVNGSNYYSVAHDTGLNQDANNRMTLAVVAVPPTGSYGKLVDKHTNGNWDDGWGMAQQGNNNNNMGFWTGDWTGSAPSNTAYVNFTPNMPSILFGYSTAASGNNNFIAYNGATAIASTGAVNTQTNTSTVKIGDQIGGTTSYAPQITEVIMYNADQSSTKNRIESYLALKYGISKTGSYVNSANSVIWDAVANTGYLNNITGISRDDVSTLYQKQSMSVNTGSQVLIGIGGILSNTNALNANTFASDRQSVIWGDNGLAKSPSVAISGITGVNYRFASVWKVQNTGLAGTVRVMWPQGLNNLKLIQNATDPAFAAGNTVTDMSANTQSVNGTVYNYADVTLANGQYFTFAAYVQAPGGVITNLQVWNRADFGTNTTTNAATVTTWANSGVTGGQLQALSGFPSHSANPTYLAASTASNFNPSVRMVQGAGLGMLNAFSANATASGTGGTFYNVSKAGAGTSPTVGYNVEMNVSNATLSAAGSFQAQMGPYISNSTTAGLFVWNTSLDKITANLLNPSNTNILGFAYTTGVAAAYPYKVNGLSITPNSYTPPLFAGRNFHLNTDTDGGVERGGSDYQEVIGYERQLSTAEQNRVESYLALKYGVTMDQTTATNYVATDGNTVWNATTNAAYNKNIAGIGRDDLTILNQKQSQSINAGSQVLIGLGGVLANTNALNGNNFASDKQYLTWGDNGLAKVPAVVISGITGVNYRFASVWKVQNTNLVGTVRVMWPQGLNNLKLVQNTTDPTFAAGNIVTDMSANTQSVNGTVYNYADVTFANGQFFTFAAYVQAPGGVVNNLRVWIKADDNPNGNTTDNVAISNWPNKGLIGGNFSGGAASPNTIALQTTGPLYRNSAAMNINFNPVAQSTSTSGLGMQNAFAGTGDDYTMFALNKNPTITGGYRNMLHFHGGANLNATSGANEYFGAFNNSPVAFPSAVGTASYTANIPAITTFSATGTGTIAYQVNSISKGSGGTLSKSGTDLLIGVDGDGGADDGIDIIMPENIMYNSVLNATDYNKVASYLAIKYGITLGTFASPVNYANTSGLSIWSTAANTYQTNVIGIARDDVEALHQRIARSQDAVADIITISTNTDFTTANSSANHTDIANDQFYFMTGNDGTATTYNAQNIMLRRWKVQSTGTAQNLFFKTSDAQATYLIYADDAAMTTNVVSVPLVSGATSGIQIPNGKFFTFSKATFCTKDPNTAAATNFTKVGITTQTRQQGWPENVPNGFIVLESKNKGFVITRTTPSAIADPKEGMLIYDTTPGVNCIKLYNGSQWKCIERSCN